MAEQRHDSLRARDLLIERVLQRQGRTLPPPQLVVDHVDLATRARTEHGESVFVVPCAPPQQLMWINARRSVLNVGFDVELERGASYDLVHRALDVIVSRHAVLRTNIRVENGRPTQFVRARASCALEPFDLSSAVSPARALDELRTRWLADPIDIEKHLVLRAAWVVVGSEAPRLLLTFHHIAVDRWSLQILAREFATVLSALVRGETPSAHEPPVTYADFAFWQTRMLEAGGRERQRKFWAEQLASAPTAIELPISRERDPSLGFAGARCTRAIDEALSRALFDSASVTKIPVFPHALTALELCLGRFAKQNDFVVGTIHANRGISALDQVVGNFINFLPLRLKARADETIGEALERAHRLLLDVHANHSLPYDEIVDVAALPSNGGSQAPRRGLYNVLLNNAIGAAGADGATSMLRGHFEEDVQDWGLDLKLVVEGTPSGIELRCDYDANVFDADVADGILEGWERAIRSLLREPSKKTADWRLPQSLRLLQERRALERQRFAIGATFTLEPIQEALAKWLSLVGVFHTITIAPLNQLFQELLSPASAFSTSDCAVGFVRLADWAGGGEASLRGLVSDLVDAVKARRGHAPLLLHLCPSDLGALGDVAPAVVAELERSLDAALAEVSRVTVVTHERMFARYPVARWSSPDADALGNVPYTDAMFTALATETARSLHATLQRPKKVVVIDADNTLWRGVVAEDGVSGVRFEAGHIALQQKLVELQRTGRLVCVSSKNELEDVLAVFSARRAEMALHEEHVLAFKVDWRPKSEHLLDLARELELGLDAFVFLDDNPVECAEVRVACPEVAVVQIPEPEGIARLVDHVWAFDVVRQTDEDRTRGEMYRQNASRREMQKGTASLAEFIRNLDLVVDAKEMDLRDVARVAQLSIRTNQFNLTGRTFSEAELVGRVASSSTGTTVVRVRDRFGDYGLVGALLYRHDGDDIVVENFLLSCRALGRGVEHAIVSGIVGPARRHGASALRMSVVETSRNVPARRFVSELVDRAHGARVEEGVFRFSLDHVARFGFDPDGGAISEPLASVVRQSIRPPARASIYSRIGNELASVDAILKWVGRSLPPSSTRSDRPPRVAPRSVREEILAGIWEEILGVTDVGVNDDFFHLGGHSLVAIQVALAVRERLGAELPLDKFLLHRTLGALAEALEEGAPVHERFEILHDEAGRYIPFALTDVQEAYFVGRRSDIALGGVACFVYVEIEIDGLEPSRLSGAVSELVARHAALRTVFRPDGTQRELMDVPGFELVVHALSELDAGSREAKLVEIRGRLSHQVIPLDQWPMFAVEVSTLGGDRHRIHFGIDLLVADARSIEILSNELASLYLADSVRPRPQITFRDWVEASRRFERTAAYHAAERYWLDRIDGFKGAPELPLAMRPERISSPRFERRVHTVPAPLVQRLATQAARSGVTASGLLLGAFTDVLAAFAKSPSFCLSLTVFNRPPVHPDIDMIVGDFTSLTLLQVDHDASATFEDRTRALQLRVLRDLDNRAFSGVKVLREIAHRRNGSVDGFTAVAFTSLLGIATQEHTEMPPAPFDSAVEVFGITETPQTWLDCQVMQAPSGEIVVRWDAIAALFPDAVLDAMFAAYVSVLTALGEAASWQSMTLVTLGKDARAVRTLANRTDGPHPTEPLHAAFFRVAAASPDRTALVAPTRRLDYGELARRARAVAGWITRQPVVPPLVGVVMSKGWEQIVGMLGVLAAGAAYVPIDAAQPIARIRQLVEQAKLSVILCAGDAPSAIDLPGVVARLDVSSQPDDAPLADLAEVELGDLAYVIFTSGSTGVPKGVMIDHLGAANTVADVDARFRVGADDAVLGLSSLHFDLSVYDVFGPLSVGGKLVLPAPADLRDPGVWSGLVEAEEITIWNSVPALMSMLVESRPAPGALRSLRLALLSGDWIPLALPDQLKALVPGISVVSLGGATEASIWSVLHPVTPLDATWTSVPYGRPMRNQGMCVLDASFEDRPDWVVGDLYITGIGLARGYLADDDKTARSFPHHPRTGERLYRTGDLARYRSDGTIELFGREDSQVKVQGFRIELGEIETAIERHRSVERAVVQAFGERGQGKRLVGFVKPKQREATPREASLAHERWTAAASAGDACFANEPIPYDAASEALESRFAERLLAAYVVVLLRERGLFAVSGERKEEREILAACSFEPRYQKWLRRVLLVLVRAGLLVQRGERLYETPQPLAFESVSSVWQEIDAVAASPWLAFLRRTADSLGPMLRGEVQPVEILFPGGEADQAETLYREGILDRCISRVRTVMRELAVRATDSAPLRVLEIGAGIGATTGPVLEAIADQAVTFAYTDLSRYFLQHGRERFGHHPFVSFDLLNVEHDPFAQGFAPRAYDVILASSVIHGTKHLRHTLANILSLLAPGGVFVFVEETTFGAGYDLSYSFQQGFDSFEDHDVRPHHAFVDSGKWLELLRASGFEDARVFDEPGVPTDHAGAYAFMARAPLHAACLPLEAAGIAAHLGGTLPEYMVPSRILLVPELPLSANGKIDRNALVEPRDDRADADAHRGPRDALDAVLLRLWEELLEATQVSIDDRFFSVGGDSLLATRFVSSLRETLEIEFSMRTFFEHPTIAMTSDVLRTEHDATYLLERASAVLRILAEESAR